MPLLKWSDSVKIFVKQIVCVFLRQYPKGINRLSERCTKAIFSYKPTQLSDLIIVYNRFT